MGIATKLRPQGDFTPLGKAEDEAELQRLIGEMHGLLLRCENWHTLRRVDNSRGSIWIRVTLQPPPLIEAGTGVVPALEEAA